MATSILTTKLYIPPPPLRVVPRLRLIERLNSGLDHKLTLVSAPAGFGKTTLLSAAVGTCEQPVAWLSLDEADNDPSRFLTHLVAALQTIAPHIGEALLKAIQSSQPPPLEAILTALVNETSRSQDEFVLVLDDYHLIEAKPVCDALVFLLEHMPPKMHLVIGTREDPQLPLARLRARGQLTELRAADLRFTPTEAAEFLKEVMELTLSADDIATLETRTEGWIAGLQLAALSMRGRTDVSQFVREFAGDNHYIVDYLVDEVLQRQPQAVRNFLLQTAILDRLSGPLCDAVTGQQKGNAQLEALGRGNFFVVPLDDRRHWYRYHHLFADVLHAHLMAERPDQVSTLHQRASAWFEQNDSPSDAIRHALAARDFARAADLVELAGHEMRKNRQEATLLSWLKALPGPLLRTRPVLCDYYAGTLLQSGELEGVETWLRFAERWLHTTPDRDEQSNAASAEMVVVDEVEFRRLPGSIAMHRAGLALAVGNVPATIECARQVLGLAAQDDHLMHGAAAALMGLATWTIGDLEAAYKSYAGGMARLQKAGYVSDAVGGAVTLADIRLTQGRIREAMSIYERGLQLATQHGATLLRGAADMHVGLSEIYLEHDDLFAAMRHLQSSKDLGEFAGLPKNRYRWRIALARLREAEGDLRGAVDLLTEAESLYTSDFSPNVRPIAAMRTRVWVVQGRLGEALAWVRECALSVEDELSYLREYEHITLARILLARYKLDREDGAVVEAAGLLKRLLFAAEQGARTASAIEILVLLSLALLMQGNLPPALTTLERALSLAEPEGYIRMFVDAGPSLAVLLEKAAKHGIAPNYVRQLLNAIGKIEHKPSVKQDLIEPLSERELEVLRLLGTDLDGPDLARELMVSLNTIRTHTKNIYTKLGVNSRRAAVRRAEELGLL